MSNIAPSNRLNKDVVGRTLDMSAEARKAWGTEWNQPTTEYEFSNGRKFVRKTEDAAIYAGSPEH